MRAKWGEAGVRVVADDPPPPLAKGPPIPATSPLVTGVFSLPGWVVPAVRAVPAAALARACTLASSGGSVGARMGRRVMNSPPLPPTNRA